MYVVATAGHVDHGKSTLVRTLTRMEPDRWAEERRRGMTIDLGFVWTHLPTGETVAFVDVPGHERFVPNMLAGVGPVPAVLLVVAADGGWMPQTEEHVAALNALGVQHAVVAITRSDLADPEPAMSAVTAHLDSTALRGAAVVPVSAVTGHGLDKLRKALSAMISGLPVPKENSPVRLWLDRSFTIRGSGTVVTGTLGAGVLHDGDRLTLHGTAGLRAVHVRGLQTLGDPSPRVAATARVAVNLRGVDKRDVARGDALLTPDAWHSTAEVDGEVETSTPLPAELTLHIGSAAVSARVRPLGSGVTQAVRLRMQRPLPLTAGDVALLRDPGAHLVVGRFRVLDVDPPALRRRGAAAGRAQELAELATLGAADGASVLHRHGVLRESTLLATGLVAPASATRVNGWLVDDAVAAPWSQQLAGLVAEHRRASPLEAGPTLEDARTALGAPDTAVVAALARHPLAVRDGRLIDVSARPPVPAEIAAAVESLVQELSDSPFSAPEAGRLDQLSLGPKELAAAERAGALLRIAAGVVLLPDADARAVTALAGIPQPFTLSEARQHLGTTRRVAVPLMELLDARGLTRRLPDDRRVLIAPAAAGRALGGPGS